MMKSRSTAPYPVCTGIKISASGSSSSTISLMNFLTSRSMTPGPFVYPASKCCGVFVANRRLAFSSALQVVISLRALLRLCSFHPYNLAHPQLSHRSRSGRPTGHKRRNRRSALTQAPSNPLTLLHVLLSSPSPYLVFVLSVINCRLAIWKSRAPATQHRSPSFKLLSFIGILHSGNAFRDIVLYALKIRVVY